MKRRILTFATAGLLVATPLTTISCSSKNKQQIHLLSVNDFHGAAPGYGDPDFVTNKENAGAIRLAQETQEIISRYPGSMLVSAGDFNAGEAFSTVTHAETFYPVLKAMDIRCSAVGNHEWEWGTESKQRLENGTYERWADPHPVEGKHYFITSNVWNEPGKSDKTNWDITTPPSTNSDYAEWKNKRVQWADPYKILDMDGHSVCLIGLTTKGTLIDGNLQGIEGLSFIDYNASVTYSKWYLQEQEPEEASKIEAYILLTHCECQPNKDDPSIIEGEAATLAKQATTHIDAVIAAHSHRECAGIIKNDNDDTNVWVGQASQSGRRFLDTTLVFDNNKPIGQRLDHIQMQVKTPFIDYGPGGKDNPDPEKAKRQIEDIISRTKYDVVRNTATEYKNQKQIALQELNAEIGTLNEDVNYYYTEHTERSFGTQYMESETLLEPAGAWASKAQIWGFNHEYENLISSNEIYPVSVAFTNLDSLKNGFLLGGLNQRPVLKKEIFSMHAFENNIYYGCLTVGQLEQYINYFLEGAARFDYSEPKAGYGFKNDEIKITKNGDTDEEPLEYSPNETIKNPETGEIVPGTSYVSGCNQFYGLSFQVTKKDERTETDPRTSEKIVFPVYQLKPGTLKIYSPTSDGCKFDDPSTWIPSSEWTENNGYIPIAIASFTWQGGNAQNRMLHHWFEYNFNSSQDSKCKERSLSQITRNFALNYCAYLTSTSKPINGGITYNFIKESLLKKIKN